jgi:Transcriptional regulator
MAINIKYRQLKAFLLAKEEGSFTHAAELLGVTQPSFTALIQELEQTLGVKLFERTTRSICLTAAGEDFYSRIRRPVADMEEAYRYAADLAAVRRGHVVPGALPSCALTLFPVALGRLRKAYPGLTVRLVEAHNGELLQMVRTNQIEFAVATLPQAVPDLASLPLVEDWFCAVFPQEHPLADVTRPTWEDIQQFDLILLSQGSSAREQFERAVPRATLDGDGPLRYDVTNVGTAAGMVREGLGVTILPRMALPQLNLAGLSCAALADETARRTISIIHRVDRSLSPAAQALVEMLRQAVQALEPELLPVGPRSRSTMARRRTRRAGGTPRSAR